MVKYIRIFAFLVFFAPFGAFAAGNDFMVAAQLLAAARNADIQQVQVLVNNGADVNFVDSTGLSVVCTALMNNDVRAAQILQMYGADASKCDQQIKKYKSKNNSKERSGGLFSGLSSVHTLTLAAAGAAVVVGGLLLMTDVFDSGGGHSSSGGGTDRPNGGDGGNNGGGTATAAYKIPYGPAYLDTSGNIAYSQAIYKSNLQQWDPTVGGIRKLDFNYLRPTVQPTDNYITGGITVPMQNYLLMMHGYSMFAAGYMGQRIFRKDGNIPLKVANGTGGGAPILVGLVTENGINPAGSAGRGNGISYADSAAANSNTYTVDKYLNFKSPCVNGTCGAEDIGSGGLASNAFDLSGSGGAMNPFASANQNALAKIIAGWENGGRALGDLYGFVPNAMLAVYKTGGGKGFVDIENPTDGAVVGTLTVAEGGTNNVISVGDVLELNGKTYEISAAGDGVTNPTITINGKVFNVASGGNLLRGKCKGTDAECENVSDIAIYLGTDNYYYVNTTGGNVPDAVYVVKNNNLYLQKNWEENKEIKTFEAITRSYTAQSNSNRVGVIVNATVNPASRKADYLNISSFDAILGLLESADKKTVFATKINQYYNSTGTETQGGYANTLFNFYGPDAPILIMPAGEFAYGEGSGDKSLTVLDATFENYAPFLYGNNLAHEFMTVVAVNHRKGTAAADSISDYGNGISDKYGKVYLSQWTDTTDNTVYMSRKCGRIGSGRNDIDPWCFAAAGATAEMATSAAGGAVAAIKAAFAYMSNWEVFSLLALTADGPYLGTDNSGNRFTKDSLAAYLKDMYDMPPEYDVTSLTSDEYLAKFAEVYGYGLINLERATTPEKGIYYYNGSKIVSAAGNAYWRAASKTNFRTSSAFNPRVASISAPFFDVLESVDGQLSLPRIWENEFDLKMERRRGLYLNDVFGDLKIYNDPTMDTMIGDIRFSMTTSARQYSDNMSGLDSMSLGFSRGKWDVVAQYQHNFTDGAGLFSGMANPIVSLAHDVLSSDIKYSVGRWNLGVRAFSGAITDSQLLENDPTVTAQYEPARLGLSHGAALGAGWMRDSMKLDFTVGMMRETNTVLGAVSDGLLDLGGGDTTYIDMRGQYDFASNVSLTGRATFARTVADPSGQYIIGMSNIDSNSFAVGINAGNLEFVASRPLAVRNGDLKYSYAKYETVETSDGKFDVVTTDAGVRRAALRPEHRETRLAATYRHNFGEFTDGAVGFIYRINPDNTDEFGNESVFMLKLSHRLGI